MNESPSPFPYLVALRSGVPLTSRSFISFRSFVYPLAYELNYVFHMSESTCSTLLSRLEQWFMMYFFSFNGISYREKQSLTVGTFDLGISILTTLPLAGTVNGLPTTCDIFRLNYNMCENAEVLKHVCFYHTLPNLCKKSDKIPTCVFFNFWTLFVPYFWTRRQFEGRSFLRFATWKVSSVDSLTPSNGVACSYCYV